MRLLLGDKAAPNFALLLSPFVFCIHFALLNDLRAPFVWNFPNTEPTVFAGREQHILAIVVVDQTHFLCKVCL